MRKVAARHQPCHLLNDTILNYPLKSPDLHIVSQLHKDSLGREMVKVSSAPPGMKLTFRFLSQLGYWRTQLYSWMTLLLAIVLQVTLVGVPTSNEGPASPVHRTTFPTVLPSVLKVKWYPACLLELKRFPSEAADHPNQGVPLYTTFVVYFMDHRRPNIFSQRTRFKMKEKGIFTTWVSLIINQRSHNQQQESLQPVSFICFTKVSVFWETIKLLETFFD